MEKLLHQLFRLFMDIFIHNYILDVEKDPLYLQGVYIRDIY